MLRLASLAALVLALAPAAASADVLKAYAELNAGGMYGKGIAGTQQNDAFFAKARGGAFGAAIGARVLFFDGQISHHEFISPDRTTWTQFRLGVAFGFDICSAQECRRFGAEPQPGHQRNPQGPHRRHGQCRAGFRFTEEICA